MIGIPDLRKYATKWDLDLWKSEKEYLLYLFLYLYYSKYNLAVFKGGTCFRFFDGLNRFSEDLDFHIKNPKLFREQVLKTIHRFGIFGIKHSVVKEEIFESSFTIKVNLFGPLYNGNSHSKNSISIDAGYRQGLFMPPEYKILDSEFVDIPKIAVKTMNRKERFAEKISALFTRKKPRDWYDVFFFKDIISVDRKVIIKKIGKGNYHLNVISKEEYNKDLKPLLVNPIPYEQLIKEVKEYINNMKI